jgi:hypothetical protein
MVKMDFIQDYCNGKGRSHGIGNELNSKYSMGK